MPEVFGATVLGGNAETVLPVNQHAWEVTIPAGTFTSANDFIKFPGRYEAGSRIMNIEMQVVTPETNASVLTVRMESAVIPNSDIGNPAALVLLTNAVTVLAIDAGGLFTMVDSGVTNFGKLAIEGVSHQGLFLNCGAIAGTQDDELILLIRADIGRFSY